MEKKTKKTQKKADEKKKTTKESAEKKPTIKRKATVISKSKYDDLKAKYDKALSKVNKPIASKNSTEKKPRKKSSTRSTISLSTIQRETPDPLQMIQQEAIQKFITKTVGKVSHKFEKKEIPGLCNYLFSGFFQALWASYVTEYIKFTNDGISNSTIVMMSKNIDVDVTNATNQQSRRILALYTAMMTTIEKAIEAKLPDKYARFIVDVNKNYKYSSISGSWGTKSKNYFANLFYDAVVKTFADTNVTMDKDDKEAEIVYVTRIINEAGESYKKELTAITATAKQKENVQENTENKEEDNDIFQVDDEGKTEGYSQYNGGFGDDDEIDIDFTDDSIDGFGDDDDYDNLDTEDDLDSQIQSEAEMILLGDLPADLDFALNVPGLLGNQPKLGNSYFGDAKSRLGIELLGSTQKKDFVPKGLGQGQGNKKDFVSTGFGAGGFGAGQSNVVSARKRLNMW